MTLTAYTPSGREFALAERRVQEFLEKNKPCLVKDFKTYTPDFGPYDLFFDRTY